LVLTFQQLQWCLYQAPKSDPAGATQVLVWRIPIGYDLDTFWLSLSGQIDGHLADLANYVPVTVL
jgi:hypothetical protein